jgi:hypothetical protein
MKERPILYSAPMVRAILNNSKTQTRRVVKFRHDDSYPLYPYGIPGDRLWARETWRVSSAHDNLAPSQIPEGTRVEYLADGPGTFDGKTRPSIFMPRWASRITLEVTEVKLQLLQRISLTRRRKALPSCRFKLASQAPGGPLIPHNRRCTAAALLTHSSGCGNPFMVMVPGSTTPRLGPFHFS